MRRSWAIMLILLSFSGCGYRLGKSFRTLPGGYEQVAIPIFENQTQIVAIEPMFTNALIEHFETSKIARVVDENVASVSLQGKILSVNFVRQAPVIGRGNPNANSEIPKLPRGTSLATQFQIQVKAELALVRNSDSKVLWNSFFDNEIVYQGPRLGTSVVNSANANYNHSSRKQKIGELALTMMQEAHDRVTENF